METGKYGDECGGIGGPGGGGGPPGIIGGPRGGKPGDGCIKNLCGICGG